MVVINRLNNLQIRHVQGPTRLQDGGGLSLRVRNEGSKSWVFTYRWNDQRPEIGLGPWPAISLADARAKAQRARTWLSAMPKRDPRAEWEKIAATDQAHSLAISFAEFAESFISERAKGWKNKDHERQWRGSLKRHCQIIWDIPINNIASGDILNCLKPIWYEIPTTAKRVMGRLELIFDAARAEGYVDGMNPAIWRGNLQSLLPKLKRKESHHAAIQLDDVQKFWLWLVSSQTMSARCVQFLLLTATRSGEARGARWEEINFDAALWTIPAARTKNSVPHRVPLSMTALKILHSLKSIPGNIVFPSSASSDVMSDRALQKLCQKSGFKDEMGKQITPHGCRAAFRTWAERCSDEDTAERALGHRRTRLLRSYARGDLLNKRMELMASWADFVTA